MMCFSPALASNVENSIVVGIQSSKTLSVRPLLPVERDMMSVYDLVYESLIYLDDNYQPLGILFQRQSMDISSASRSLFF